MAVFFAAAEGEAGNPIGAFSHVGLGRFGLSVESDEDNGEEDDIADDDEHKGDTAPLELEDAADTAVGLACGDSADAAGVAGQAGGVFGGGGGLVE